MDGEGKLVSVIMPVLNAERYLKEAVESILNQTHQNLELLAVDDGSADGTLNILSDYAGRDKRVRVLRNSGSGISAALNMGIDLAKGEYIARMDADDISFVNRIENQVVYMENHTDIGICSTQIQLLGEDGSYHDTQKCPEENDRIRLELLNRCVIAHPTVMFRGSAVRNRWRYHIMPEEDYDLWTRMAAAEKFACLPEILLYYRMHSDSVSRLVGKETKFIVSNTIIKTYISHLFAIDVCRYKGNEFYIMDDSAVFEEPVKCYMFRQFQLLKEISLKNEERSIFDKKIVEEFLCRRWRLVWEEIGLDQKIVPSQEAIGDLNRLLLRSESDVQIIFEHFFDQARSLLKQAKRFVIYGLGNHGRKLLEDWNRAEEIDSTNWELAALVDKNMESVHIAQTSYPVMKPNLITEVEWDYVLISSRIYYDEIESELTVLGIEKSRILYGGNMFNLIFE